MKQVIEVDLNGTALEDAERQLILGALRATNGSTQRAADLLGCSVRKIQYKLREWGLKLPPLGCDPDVLDEVLRR